jgi:arginine/ornithine transport system permease protein
VETSLSSHPTPSRRSLKTEVVPILRALPQYGNEAVFMLQGSVVASVITIQDILGAGRTLNSRYYLAYEGILTAAVLYMAITFLLVAIFRQLEVRYLGYLKPRSTAA